MQRFISPAAGSLFHVSVGARKIVLQHVVRGPVGDGAEPEGGLDRGGVLQPAVVQAAEVGELLPGDHESREVGSVDGQEDQGKGRPHVGHEPGGVASRAVDVDGRLEQNRPDQPQGPQERKLPLGVFQLKATGKKPDKTRMRCKLGRGMNRQGHGCVFSEPCLLIYLDFGPGLLNSPINFLGHLICIPRSCNYNGPIYKFMYAYFLFIFKLIFMYGM